MKSHILSKRRLNAIKLRQKGGKMGRRERQKWGEEEMNKVKELIKANRGMIESKWFKEQHRKTQEAFSRVRKLSFPVLIVLIVQKSV